MADGSANHLEDWRPFSVAILAGGKSERMRSDKAFVEYNGRSFISRIVAEASRASEEVLVVIGDKDRGRFESELGTHVRIAGDAHRLGAPLGGMLTAFEVLGSGYAAVIGCDSPLVKHELLQSLRNSASSHSAAVPVWESGEIEPLCSVYDVGQARVASLAAIAAGKLKCRDMIARLPDVNYVPVSNLRAVDPALDSLVNVNTPDDLEALRRVPFAGAAPLGAPSGPLADR